MHDLAINFYKRGEDEEYPVVFVHCYLYSSMCDNVLSATIIDQC